jgi:glucose-6-phosphate 1-dehydrogenase
MVIFGATGDLAKRLVVPALYNLSRTGALPDEFALIGIARGDETAKAWGDSLYSALQSYVGNRGSAFNVDHIETEAWTRLASKMTYIRGDLTDSALYGKIRDALGNANAIFYLAIVDQLFGEVVEQLGKAGLTEETEANGTKRWRRVVIEKPFGHSLDSARELNSTILRTLHEDQIFRIDHFLGKDTVQNILAFRFGNGLFEPIWTRDRIDHV